MAKPRKAQEAEGRIAENRKARHDFLIEKKIEAGLVLQGSEVKSCRAGQVQLVDAYAAFERGELFLLKAHIAEYKQGGPYFNHPPQRKRKLLLHRRELKQLREQMDQGGYSLVPLRLYFSKEGKGSAKVELGLAKGKKKADKRESAKGRSEERDMDRARRRDR